MLAAFHLNPNPVQVIARGVSTLAAASTVMAMLMDSSKPLEVDLRGVPGRSLVRSGRVSCVPGGRASFGACVTAHGMIVSHGWMAAYAHVQVCATQRGLLLLRACA